MRMPHRKGFSGERAVDLDGAEQLVFAHDREQEPDGVFPLAEFFEGVLPMDIVDRKSVV